MSAKNYLVDANVLLRYLLNDEPSQTKEASQILKLASVRESLILCIPEVTVAEVFYVLTGPRVGLSRTEAAQKVKAVLQAAKLDVINQPYVFAALDLCENCNIPFGDAILAVYSQMSSINFNGVISFDRHFEKIPDVAALTPARYLRENKK